MELPLAPVERILKKTNMRVSDEAVEEFAKLLEEIIVDIASESAAIAKSQKRRTVLVEDVVAARRRVG